MTRRDVRGCAGPIPERLGCFAIQYRPLARKCSKHWYVNHFSSSRHSHAGRPVSIVILTEVILAGGVALGAATALILVDSIKVGLWPKAALLQTRWPQLRHAVGADPVRDRGCPASPTDRISNERLLVTEPAPFPMAVSQLSGLDRLDIYVLTAFMFVMTAEYATIARGEFARAWADLPLKDRLPMLISLIEQLQHWIAVLSRLQGI